MSINATLLRKLNIPRPLWYKSLDDYVGDDEEAVDVIEHYIKELPSTIDSRGGRGLLLVGPPGRGKTLFACAVLQAAGEAGYTGLFQLIGDYFKLLRDIMSFEQIVSRTGDDTYAEEWDRLRSLHVTMRNKLDVLVLDDVGKEHATHTRWAEDEFDLLLRHRFHNGLPTVLTSNRPVDKWATSYNASMESFIHEAFEIVALIGSDHRRA